MSDQMWKVARSLMKDFMAGVDPTGTRTFQYGMEDTAKGKPSSVRRAVGTAGGVVGGAAAVPAAVGGVVGAIKGFALGKGKGGRLMGALKGAKSGAIKPYTSLFRGVRARRALQAQQAGKKLTERQVGDLSRFAGEHIPVGGEKMQQAVRRGVQRMTPEMAGEASKRLSGEIAGGGAALGLSGLVGGGSAYMQYGKGAKTQQSVNRQLRAAGRVVPRG